MDHGFVRVAVAIPEVKVADCRFNSSKMIELIEKAEHAQVEIISFPELSITGYTCGDLFMQQQLLNDAEKALTELLLKTYATNVVIIAGMPIRSEHQLYNAAIVFQSGKILGIVPKTHLPNNKEFYEKRWFTSGADARTTTIRFNDTDVPFGTNLLFNYGEATFGIEICEDLWMPLPTSTQHCLHGADMIFNLSASNELIGKHQYRRQLVEQQSARCNAGYIYVAAGFGESSTDLVYAGIGLIAENGNIIATAERFSFEPQLIISEIDVEKLQAEKLRNSNFYHDKSESIYRKAVCKKSNYTFSTPLRSIEKHPFIPPLDHRDAFCEEVFSIQIGGLAQRWIHTQAKTLIIGISGGLDSTLALLVCVKTADKLGFDRKRIIGITMPGFGTTDRTYNNALQLMQSLGITTQEISIKDACLQHFKDINHDIFLHDVTFENTQARERTQILMDIANQKNGLVIGTGNLSEMALGWATYNGDHMSMYAVNSSIPKTLVRFLTEWASHQLENESEIILKDVLNTPFSPELLPADKHGNIAQKTEDVVGPYELHDFFLYYFVRFGFTPDKIFYLAKHAYEGVYTTTIIAKWLKVFLKRFFAQQFKRSCMPDGPKVGSINLSPRGDWKMPSDAVAFEWEYQDEE